MLCKERLNSDDNNSTNINKTSKHFSLITKKKTTTYVIGNRGHGLEQPQKCGGVKQVKTQRKQR